MPKEIFFPEIFPVLKTERLLLREAVSSDSSDLFLLRSSINVMQHSDREPWKTVSEAEEMIIKLHNWFITKEAIQWGICLKGSDRLIGTIGFRRMNKEHFRTEIGYLLHPDHWKKGIMLEAMHTCIDYAFGVMNFHSIEANINPSNMASIKLCEKAGFIKEAYIKENFYYKGRFPDSVIYSVLNPQP